MRSCLIQRKTMAPTAFVILLLLCCTLLTQGAGACNANGPGNCTFQFRKEGSVQSTLCDWEQNGNFALFHYLPNGTNWFAALKRDKNEGTLSSREACPTRGETHCLWFSYKFESRRAIELSVSINHYWRGVERELKLWSGSQNTWRGWNRIGVPFETYVNFRVVFQAKRRHKQEAMRPSVFVDNIIYWKSPCQLYIPDAISSPAASSTKLFTSTTTTRMMSAPPTRPSLPVSTTLTTSTKTLPNSKLITSPVSARVTAKMTTTQVSENAKRTANQTQSKVKIIVAVTVVVLLIIAVVSTVLLVLRRKQLHYAMPCYRKQEPKEQLRVNASDNAAYSLDADDPVMDHTRQNLDNHHREAGTSSISPCNHAYENSPSDNPSQPVYTIVNKPGKTGQANGESNRTIYELCNENATNNPQATGTEYQNLPPKTKQEQGGPSNDSTPIQTVSNGYSLAQPQITDPVYHILEKDPEAESRNVYHVPNTASRASSKDPDTEYNRLNFNHKSDAEAENCDEKKSEKVAGGVYNHLNEGSGDAYSEVHREKKAEVIDGVYSHIK